MKMCLFKYLNATVEPSRLSRQYQAWQARGQMVRQDKVLTLIILGVWIIYKSSESLSDGFAPSLVATLTQVGEERQLWELAGDSGIRSMTASLPRD
jgi:hypothetical protein